MKAKTVRYHQSRQINGVPESKVQNSVPELQPAPTITDDNSNRQRFLIASQDQLLLVHPPDSLPDGLLTDGISICKHSIS